MDANRSPRNRQAGCAHAEPPTVSVSRGWIYRDRFPEAEKERVSRVLANRLPLKRQPGPGGLSTADFLNEPLVAGAQPDGGVKRFFNVCRHRASRELLPPAPRFRDSARASVPLPAWTYRAWTGGSRPFRTARNSSIFSPDQTASDDRSEIYKGSSSWP